MGMHRPEDPMQIFTIFVVMAGVTFFCWLWHVFFTDLHSQRSWLERVLAVLLHFLVSLGVGAFWLSFIIYTWISRDYFPIFLLTFIGVIVGFWIARKRWKDFKRLI